MFGGNHFVASLYDSTAESSPRSHSLRMAWSSFPVNVPLMFIHARCIAPAAEPDLSGSPPKLRTADWSSLTQVARSFATWLKKFLRSGALTLSAASLNPSCPSLQVSMRSLSALITLSLSIFTFLHLFVLSSEEDSAATVMCEL